MYGKFQKEHKLMIKYCTLILNYHRHHFLRLCKTSYNIIRCIYNPAMYTGSRMHELISIAGLKYLSRRP